MLSALSDPGRPRPWWDRPELLGQRRRPGVRATSARILTDALVLDLGRELAVYPLVVLLGPALRGWPPLFEASEDAQDAAMGRSYRRVRPSLACQAPGCSL